MKRLLSIVCLALLGACTTVAPGTPTSTTASAASTPAVALTPAQVAAQKLSALAMKVNQQCTVAKPFLASMVSIQTDPNALAIATQLNTSAGQICTLASGYLAAGALGVAVPAFTLAGVQGFVDNNVPQLLTLVKASSKLSADQKTAAELAITGAQTILSIAVANAQ
jgi:hypothetical protein